MPKVKLTQQFINKLQAPKEKQKEQYFDTEHNGLMLEAKSTGSKTYYYRYRVNQKQKMQKIDNANDITLDTAIQKYYELKESIQTQQQEIQPQEEPLNPITFQEFYDTYYLPYIKIHVKSYETNISIYKNHILPDLANTQMINLKKPQVMSLHSNMTQEKHLAPATANKFLIFLSHAYRLAHELEILPNTINPTKGVKEYELNNQRQIFLNKAQTKKLLQMVELSPNQHLQFIVPMLLLTGARKREVLDAEWSNFDMLNNLWTIPITKSGKKRILPITPPLKELLE